MRKTIDPNKVIKVEPKMIKEDFSNTKDKTENESKFTKYFWKGFFSGWMISYIIFKLITGQ